MSRSVAEMQDGTQLDDDPKSEAGKRPAPCRKPRRLRVDTRPVTAHDFAYIVEPLTAVCTAAIETGNPVIWC